MHDEQDYNDTAQSRNGDFGTLCDALGDDFYQLVIRNAETDRIIDALRSALDEDLLDKALRNIGKDRISDMFDRLKETLGADNFSELVDQHGIVEAFAEALELAIRDTSSAKAVNLNKSLLNPAHMKSNSDHDWRPKGTYPHLTWKSHVRKRNAGSVSAAAPLISRLKTTICKLFERCHRAGESPRVLVCMPFSSEPPEIAFRLVIRPLVEDFFGGRCIRYVDSIDGDWRRLLRLEMLHSHLAIFDLSFNNPNVDREKQYFDRLMFTSMEKRYASSYFAYRFETLRNAALPELRTFCANDDSIDCLLYDCTDDDLAALAESLIFKMIHSLSSLGFVEGVEGWVRCQRPKHLESNRDTIAVTDDWVERVSPPPRRER